MITRFVTANGLRLRLIEAGEGPLVLLVHGFPETALSWRHQLAGLAAAGFRAVAPDLRGYGGSDSPADPARFGVLDVVGDLVGLLDALQVDHCLIVGNDWGSTIAWQAALLRPDRFHGVVALGVPMMGQPPVPPTSLFPQNAAALFYTLYFQPPGLAEAELERDPQQSLSRILFAASGEAGPRQPGDGTPNPFGMVDRSLGLLAPLPDRVPGWLDPATLAAQAADFAAGGFRGGLNYYRNLDANWHLSRPFAGLRVEVPALFLAGERDPGLAIPGMADLIAGMGALVPRLRDSRILPGCGHWLPQERPAELTAAILQLARSLQPGG